MPTTFSFNRNDLRTQDYLLHTSLRPGVGTGVNDPDDASAIAPNQAIDLSGDVDVFAITLFKGQSYTFDVDDGSGDRTGGSVDLEFDLIDAKGRLITNVSDASRVDSGSSNTLDPLFAFTVNRTGTYYVAIHSEGVDYIDEGFRFAGSGGTGDYTFIVSSPDVPRQTRLTDGSDAVSFSSADQNVLGLAGDDTIALGGGDDIANGGDGDDTVVGGSGADEIAGGAGRDTLLGGDAADVLVGGTGNDRLNGGGAIDHLNGGSGADRLIGATADDILLGQDGRDNLNGGRGDDFLRGGAGVDVMRGGDDSDTFHFLNGEARYDATGLNEDRIQDFSFVDIIDLSDAALGRLDFVGSSAFSGARQVRVQDFRSVNGYQEVQVNLDADQTPEMAFLVRTSGGFTLQASDFLL